MFVNQSSQIFVIFKKILYKPEICGGAHCRSGVDAEGARDALQGLHGVFVASVDDAHAFCPVDSVHGAEDVDGRASLVPADGRLRLDGHVCCVRLKTGFFENLGGALYDRVPRVCWSFAVVVGEQDSFVFHPGSITTHL